MSTASEDEKRRWEFRIGAWALVAFMAIRLFISLQNTALATDEFVHIPAGYVHLTIHRFDFNPEHPPLIKMLSAVPLLILKPSLPGDPQLKKDWTDWFKFCTDFFYLPVAKERQIVTWARVPMILVSCFLGLLIFEWAGALFSRSAGIFALLLYTMEPNILAFSRFVYTDMGASLVYSAFFYLAWRCWRSPSFARLLLACFVACLSALVKHSMIVIFPMYLVFLVILVFAGKIPIRTCLVHAVLSVLMLLLLLNLGYGFRTHAFDANDLRVVSGWFGIHTEKLGINKYLDHYSILPVPPDYIRGLDLVMNHNRQGHYAYLFGRFSSMGWWYYFPLTFLVKVPLPVMIITLIAVGWLAAILCFRRSTDSLFLLLPMLLYGGFSLTSNINIGIRHILPIFPFLFISAGGLWHFLHARASRWRWAVAALGAWTIVGSLAIRYDPLEYFNDLAGGPQNGWRYLGESNIDAGQNMIRLADYLRETKPKDIYLYLIGVDFNLLRDEDYSIFSPMKLSDDFRPYFPYSFREEYGTLKPGIYAISVCRMLDPYMYSPVFSKEDLARALTLQRFLTIEPDKKIGNVIWIYNLTEEQIARLNLSQLEFYYFMGLKHIQP
jgi:hypothetical protein